MHTADGVGTGLCCHIEQDGETRKEAWGGKMVRVGARMRCICRAYVEDPGSSAYTIDGILALRQGDYPPGPTPVIMPPYTTTYDARWESAPNRQLPAEPEPPQPKPASAPVKWPPRRELDL